MGGGGCGGVCERLFKAGPQFRSSCTANQPAYPQLIFPFIPIRSLPITVGWTQKRKTQKRRWAELSSAVADSARARQNSRRWQPFWRVCSRLCSDVSLLTGSWGTWPHPETSVCARAGRWISQSHPHPEHGPALQQACRSQEGGFAPWEAMIYASFSRYTRTAAPNLFCATDWLNVRL